MITNTEEPEYTIYGVKILEFLKEVLKLPYHLNAAAESGAVHNTATHEQKLNEMLINIGFNKLLQIPSFLKKKIVLNWEDNIDLLDQIPDGTFIEQPFGKQNNPDFIIKVNKNCWLMIESKTAKTSTPLYNSGGVTGKYIYIFSSKKYNETTIFKGSSIITIEQQRLIKEHIERAKQADIELNTRLRELDTTNRGIDYHTRPMIGQSGGNNLTDYFKHSDRQTAEEDVMNYVRELCYSR